MADLVPIPATEQEARAALATMLLRANFIEFFDRLQKILDDQRLGELSETDGLWKLRALYAELTAANEQVREFGGILPDELP
jgi:hypothetical protein